MKTSRFKTNAKCGGCVAKIAAHLSQAINRDQWNIDISSPERILTITSELSDDEIIGMITAAGFKAEKMEG